MMLVGAKLKRIREEKRYSQQEIAAILQVSQKTYSNMESDKSKPTIEQLSTLSTFLDFNLLELLQEQGIVFNQNNNFTDNSTGVVVNNLPENLMAQFEARLQEKEEIIILLKEKISWLEKK